MLFKMDGLRGLIPSTPDILINVPKVGLLTVAGAIAGVRAETKPA